MGGTRAENARTVDRIQRIVNRRPLAVWLVFISITIILPACGTITADFDRIIAIQIDGPQQRNIVLGDTLRLTAVVLDARGNEVTDAEVLWFRLDVDTMPFTLDSMAGIIVGRTEGTGRVEARVETLRSDPITVTVSPVPTPSAVGVRGVQRGP